MEYKEDFTDYDIKPQGFVNYLRYNGHHFNKKLCQFACRRLGKDDYTKEKIEASLKMHNIVIDDCPIYDVMYVANWARATLLGSSLADEKHVMLFVKDIMEKEGDLVFNRWYADMARKGVQISWEDMI